MKRTVISMLHEASRTFTNEAFVAKKGEDGWWHKTFLEVQRDSRAFAATLVDRGIRKNGTVAILAEGSPDWVTGEFGVLLAGGISVPLSIKLLSEEISFRINHSEASFILVSKNMLAKLAQIYDRVDHELEIIVIDEDGATLEELRETAGAEVLLFKELLLQGYRLLDDMHIALDKIEDDLGEDDVVTISYTSGTTGDPKGIMLTHLNYYANCHDSVNMFKVPPMQYSTLVILPCDHSFAHSVGIYSALLRGITLYFVDARGGGMAIPRNIPVNLKETNPVFLLTVPALTENFMKKIRAGIRAKGSLLRKLFESGLEAGIAYHGDGYSRSSQKRRISTILRYRLADALVFSNIRKIFGKNLRFCVGGGALLDIQQQQFFNAIGVPIYQGYGLTEAAPVISSNLPDTHKFGTSGVIAPSVECLILNEEGETVATGTRGEIAIRGNNVMKGYFKNREATEKTLRDGLLFTGDLGYFDEDGFLVVVGRRKALLISSDGEKYSPEEIEEAIVNSSDYISQAVLYNDHNDYTTALIVPDMQNTREYISSRRVENAKELIEFFSDQMNAFRRSENYKNRFPRMWLPATFQIVTEPFSEDNKMVNSTMKLVRHKIFEYYRDRVEYMYGDEGKHWYNPRNIEAVLQLYPELSE